MNTFLSQLIDKLHSELERRIEMDNEYRYGNIENNNAEENVQETVQESVEVQQELATDNTEQSENTSVNFVLYNSETQNTEESVEMTSESENTTKEQKSEQTVANSQNMNENITYSYSYVNPTPQPKKKKNLKISKTWKKWVLCVSMAVVFGLVASAVFQTSNLIVRKITGVEETPNKSVSTTITKGNSSNKELTNVAEVASNVMPSVVSITNLSVQEVQNFFFGGTTMQEYESTGSGIVVGQNDKELLIVSNNHVVEGSTTLTVSFIDGSNIEAVIKGTDANLDLAIIAVPLNRIESSTLDAIKIATLGDSDALAVGEPAIAIGNALGYGQSVTSGIISALNRQIEGFDASLIQTDAAINPGNSGGALVNANGEVIGINTVKVSADAVEGMGYAIPISDVNDIINELMNRETRSKVDESKRGTIGISGVDVDESASQLYNMPEGVHVSEVIKGGAADKAGIPKGCIIVKFGGTSIKSMSQLQEQLAYYKAGEKVDIVVMIPDGSGEYKEKTYEIKLSEQSILNN